MKTFVAIVILFIIALCVLNAAAPPHDMGLWLNGQQIDGPLEGLFALVLAGGGLLIAGVALAAVVLLVGLLFAGLGVVVVGVLALVGVLVALAISPLLLPLLLVGAVIWLVLGRRERRERSGRFTPRADADHVDQNAKA